MTRLVKFMRMPVTEQILWLRAVAAVAGVRLGLRIIGFERVRRLAARRPTSRQWCVTMGAHRGGITGAKAVSPPLERIIWAIESASRRVPGGSNCLVRALAAQSLLGRFGYPAELRIGGRRGEPGGFSAHAWLEHQGRVIIGEFELDKYASFGQLDRVACPDSALQGPSLEPDIR